ncbi:unnamed protein product [Caenorhabditis angaria]|uniref:PDZ domain-containing protein n=1 Tax=Caenorhabditis angaria TaxID=860376 RepID=A0A9P1IGK8_9PELO|nr:unnamed protein product [Caenorhabditis angaria]
MSEENFEFNFQLAHGSSNVIIKKWKNTMELYQSIAREFEINPEDIMFMTVNESKISMRNLFNGSLDFGDIIYVHIRGQSIEIELFKDSDMFGVTIADNGIGNAFIKIIQHGSIFDRAASLKIGQMFEKINGENVLGYRHYRVAKVLRSIRKGQHSRKGSIRFKMDGGHTIEDLNDKLFRIEICEKLNRFLDSYLGVQDDELSMRIWELSENCVTLRDFEGVIEKSEIADFELSSELVVELWEIIEELRKMKNISRQPKPRPRKAPRKSVLSVFE